MNYGNQNQQQQQSYPQVVVQSSNALTPMSVEVEMVPWSWCNLVTAVIGFFCCQLFGFIATVMALLSYTDHKAKSFEMSRSKRCCSYGFGIAAIVIGSICIIIAIVIVAIFGAQVSALVTQAQQQQRSYGGHNSISSNLNQWSGK